MSNWYTPDGDLYEGCNAAIGSEIWLKAHRKIGKDLANEKLHRVALTKLKHHYVFTVWLGLDHSFGRFLGRDEPPLIFETMVFKNVPKKMTIPGFNTQTELNESVEMNRYSTKAQALKGHKKMVDKWRKAQ